MCKIVSAKTARVGEIRIIFEVLKDLLSDTSIEFINQPLVEKKKKQRRETENEIESTFSGMRIIAISQDHTVMICLKLYSKNFIEFACVSQSTAIGVNLAKLNNALKMSANDDDIEFYIDGGNEQELGIAMHNEELHKRADVRLKLLDLGQIDMILPPIVADVRITMPSSDFHRLCKNMSLIGQQLEIKCTNNTLIFSCDGGSSACEIKYGSDGSGVKIMFTHPNKDLIIQGVYNLKQLNVFAKCVNLSSDVQIMMKVDKFPLLLEYAVGDLGNFIACVSPIDVNNVAITDEHEKLYQSDDDDVKLKSDFDDQK